MFRLCLEYAKTMGRLCLIISRLCVDYGEIILRLFCTRGIGTLGSVSETEPKGGPPEQMMFFLSLSCTRHT